MASQLGEFLRARRARLSPADVGLPSGLGPRRTPGLRREELAAVAGLSIDSGNDRLAAWAESPVCWQPSRPA